MPADQPAGERDPLQPLLERTLGPGAVFRDGQGEAIEANLAAKRTTAYLDEVRPLLRPDELLARCDKVTPRPQAAATRSSTSARASLNGPPSAA